VPLGWELKVAMIPNENDPKVVEQGQEYEDALKKEVLICIGLCLLITVIFFCLHFVPFLKPSFETTGSWLERFGALVGAMAMYIEFRSKRISTIFDNASVRFPPEFLKKSIGLQVTKQKFTKWF